MRKKEKTKILSRLEIENLQAKDLAAAGDVAGLLVLNFVRQGEILQQLQELQANSWLR